MKKLNGRFTTIPNNLITSNELSGSEFKVLCYLCMLSDIMNYSFPSYDKIHQEIGLATSTVKLAVRSALMETNETQKISHLILSRLAEPMNGQRSKRIKVSLPAMNIGIFWTEFIA